MDPVGSAHYRGSRLFHLLTRASKGAFLPLFLSWDIRLLNRKPSMTVGQQKGHIPSPEFWGHPLGPGEHCESTVMVVPPVPWGMHVEPSGDLTQKERSSLESGHRRGAAAPPSITRRVTAGAVCVIKLLPYLRDDGAEAHGRRALP